MAKRTSVNFRIDSELKQLIEEFAKKNEMTRVQASREIAKLRRNELSKSKVLKELRW